jgi:hypothetical protein
MKARTERERERQRLRCHNVFKVLKEPPIDLNVNSCPVQMRFSMFTEFKSFITTEVQMKQA